MFAADKNNLKNYADIGVPKSLILIDEDFCLKPCCLLQQLLLTSAYLGPCTASVCINVTRERHISVPTKEKQSFFRHHSFAKGLFFTD